MIGKRLFVLRDFHFSARYGHLMTDGFSIPFLAAAALGLFTLAAAMRFIPCPAMRA